MGVVYNRREFGLVTNGDFNRNTNYNFTAMSNAMSGQIIPTGGYQNLPFLQVVGGGGSFRSNDEYIPVDTSDTYQMIIYGKTIQRGSAANSLGGGYIGFICYDKYLNFIDLQSCGSLGDTILSRDLNTGDSYAYIQDATAWSTGSINSRYCLLYPATHPDYSVPYKYTRIGFGANTIAYKSTVTQMPEGDYQLELANSSDVPTVFPNVGYPTPSGTPVSNGRSGGTYNYALSLVSFPETWTRYSTAPFSGESRNSTTPFRFGTTFIKFMMLANYTAGSEVPQDHVWGLSKVFFSRCVGSRDYRRVL